MKHTMLLATGALCFIFSCAAPAASPGQPANAEVDTFIGSAVVLSADVPTTVMVGGEFAVVLEENPSTGYTWDYSIDPTGLAVETAKESFAAVPEPMAGSPVNTVWKFRADAEGEATLTYLYYRPWEKPETAINRQVFTVKIVR
ncbi:MAG: protease inhibitor I42 family protein [Deltaproteobacteria bacterium]|nr:protease inhibitor I42 family protein [Candidatus Zymogenaceae bacterium]